MHKYNQYIVINNYIYLRVFLCHEDVSEFFIDFMQINSLIWVLDLLKGHGMGGKIIFQFAMILCSLGKTIAFSWETFFSQNVCDENNMRWEEKTIFQCFCKQTQSFLGEHSTFLRESKSFESEHQSIEIKISYFFPHKSFASQCQV